MPDDKARIALIGCGNVAHWYLQFAKHMAGLEVAAIVDAVPAAAQSMSDRYGVPARPLGEVLGDRSIGFAVNLTPPASHFDVSSELLAAGKHVFSEKPLGVSLAEGTRLLDRADALGLKVGCAPDTFLGAGHRTARRLLDAGRVGTILSGTAVMMTHGMEHWHPAPHAYFQPGAGPVFDIGPYYITALAALLGPVRRVAAMSSTGFSERTISAPGPFEGKTLPVDTPTHYGATLTFVSGAVITLLLSWDVWKHGHAHPIELHGTTGSMFVPDPNMYSGGVSIVDAAGEVSDSPTDGLAFGKANWMSRAGIERANYRMLGVVDLVDAVRTGREPRSSGRLALHVVDVMESLLVSAREHRFVDISTVIERPSALPEADASRYETADA